MSRKKVKSRRRLLFVLAIVFMIITAIVIVNYRSFIFPPLFRNRPSPKAYIEKMQRLLPEAAAISLQVFEHGSRTKPQVALTFDADMTPAMKLMLTSHLASSWYNAKIKEILDRDQAPATVFLGGLWTQTYPAEAKALAGDPLVEIGNHSFNHYAFANNCFGLPVISNDSDTNDVETAQNIIREATGVTPKYFRFPGGCYESVDILTVARLGLTVVHWDTVSGDGFNNNANSIVNNVETRVQNGSIIVMHIHDGAYAPKTAEALERIIPDLRARGFTFVKVSELMQSSF